MIYLSAISRRSCRSLLFRKCQYLRLLRAPGFHGISTMKRKAVDTKESPQVKRQKEPIPDYCHVQPRKDGNGNQLWPASSEAVEKAREFIREWYALQNTSIDCPKLTTLTDCQAPHPTRRYSSCQIRTQMALTQGSSYTEPLQLLEPKLPR